MSNIKYYNVTEKSELAHMNILEVAASLNFYNPKEAKYSITGTVVRSYYDDHKNSLMNDGISVYVERFYFNRTFNDICQSDKIYNGILFPDFLVRNDIFGNGNVTATLIITTPNSTKNITVHPENMEDHRLGAFVLDEVYKAALKMNNVFISHRLTTVVEYVRFTLPRRIPSVAYYDFIIEDTSYYLGQHQSMYPVGISRVIKTPEHIYWPELAKYGKDDKIIIEEPVSNPMEYVEVFTQIVREREEFHYV